MKTKIVSVILILVLLTAVLCACNTLPTSFTLKYTASEGGRVIGETEQKVEEGKDGESVMAVADEGYYFVGWSDGITTPIRQETNVSGNIAVTAQFEQSTQQTTFTVKYLCNEGGSIEGEATQTVEKGYSATEVTAVPDEGYEFVKWSDDVTTATRRDGRVKSNITVTAIFKKIEEPEPLTKTYSLNYNFGEAEDKPEKITFVENEIEGVTLPVLTREHFTFHGWYCGDEQVADTGGKLLLDEELLTLKGEEIYAKFTADETFTYKILLVYVTRIDAVLPHKDKSITEKVHVDYTMSDQERELCHLLTLRTRRQLNDMLDGLVEFQVDEYYTTETINEDSYFTSFGPVRINNLMPLNIAEVKDMVDNYDSCLAITNHGVKFEELHVSAGSAIIKHAEVRLEGFLRIAFDFQHLTMEKLLDLFRKNEDYNVYGETYLIDTYIMEPITHELAHTIEQRVNLFDYHSCAVGRQTQYPGPFETNRAYYLNEFDFDGEKVGIPYKFWKGDVGKITYKVTQDIYGDDGFFDCARNGTVIIPGEAALIFEVIYGESITVSVRAYRPETYKFVQWSDGVMTAERTDLITGDFTVTAIFEKV